MSTKNFSRSTIKTIKVTCDRCQQIVEGIRGEEFSAGFYDMSKWETGVTTSVTSVNHVIFAALNTSSVTALAFESDVQFNSPSCGDENFEFVWLCVAGH